MKTGEDGKESILRICSGGDLIGHRSFLSNEYFQASAIALSDVDVCFVDKIALKR